jgi:hypothetical protein
MKKYLTAILYYASYLLLFLLFLETFYIFQPFTITNHDKSSIVCEKNNLSYEFGLNLIFAIDNKLDPQADKNIRKLCEYSIINDFQDTYKTPSRVNYFVDMINETDGSWGDTLLVSLAILSLSIIFVEICKNRFAKEQKTTISIKFIIFGAGVIIFLLLLKNPSQKLFCNRVMASNLANFKKSAYGYGLQRLQLEEPHIQSFIQEVYLKCLKN